MYNIQLIVEFVKFISTDTNQPLLLCWELKVCRKYTVPVLRWSGALDSRKAIHTSKTCQKNTSGATLLAFLAGCFDQHLSFQLFPKKMNLQFNKKPRHTARPRIRRLVHPWILPRFLERTAWRYRRSIGVVFDHTVNWISMKWHHVAYRLSIFIQYIDFQMSSIKTLASSNMIARLPSFLPLWQFHLCRLQWRLLRS